MRRSLIWIAALSFTIGGLLPACSQQPVPMQTTQPPAATSNTAKEPAAAPPPVEQQEQLPAYPITVTDDLGRKVTINKLPQRIVSLAPSNTEILFALGLDDRIIGVTDYCNYPDAAKNKTRVAGYSTPDLEKLVSLQPDLVVTTSIHEKTVLPALERLGITVYITEAATLDAILSNISNLGKITGKTANSSRVLDAMNSKINNIVEKTKTLSPAQRLRVLYVNWQSPIRTVGGGNYINDVIFKAGGINVYEADFEKFGAVSLESVVIKNPQVIFVSGMGTTGEVVYKAIKDEIRLHTVDAALNNRIFRISDANLIERPGPRIIEGLTEVASMIHPEMFGDAK